MRCTIAVCSGLRAARAGRGSTPPREPDPPALEPLPLDAAAVGARIDALVDVIVRKYAPLPARSLAQLMSFLRAGVPQWTRRACAGSRARETAARRELGWTVSIGFGPPRSRRSRSRWQPDEEVRLLTPFDPVVWDRRRFEIFWGWPYRFEAYTPAAKRKLGYYALPLLWRERVDRLGKSDGFGRPSGRLFRLHQRPSTARSEFHRALEAELERMRDIPRDLDHPRQVRNAPVSRCTKSDFR